jgi:hypothetical protein
MASNSRCSAASIASDKALKACGRFNLSVTTPRSSWLRKTTGSSRSNGFAVGAGSIDTEGAFTGLAQTLLLKFQI